MSFFSQSVLLSERSIFMTTVSLPPGRRLARPYCIFNVCHCQRTKNFGVENKKMSSPKQDNEDFRQISLRTPEFMADVIWLENRYRWKEQEEIVKYISY